MKKLLILSFLLLSMATAQAYSPPTGTGLTVLNNGPTLIAPHLGTPADGVATNLTGTAASLTCGTANAVAASAITGTTLAAGVTASSLTSFGASIALGTPASGVATNLTGTAASLTCGTATAVAASGITGTTLASGVTASSLTSFGASIALGTPTSGVMSNTTSATQSANDNSTKLATTAYVDRAAATIVQNSQSTAYTTVLSDAGKAIYHPAADVTARNFTIDSNGTVPYPVGTTITFINEHGAGVITIKITSDTMRLAGAGTTGDRTLAADGVATAYKMTSTTWIISGAGLT